MNQTFPVIIKKSLVGLALILLAGLGLIAIIWGTIVYLLSQGQLAEQFYYLLAFFSVIVLLGTFVAVYVYRLSYIQLTDTDITVIQYNSLFNSLDGSSDWTRVQDVSVKKLGILPALFNYGTLQIQTAGTGTNFVFTYTPNIEYWQAVIQAKSDENPVDA